jgi:hypothetical protein
MEKYPPDFDGGVAIAHAMRPALIGMLLVLLISGETENSLGLN